MELTDWLLIVDMVDVGLEASERVAAHGCFLQLSYPRVALVEAMASRLALTSWLEHTCLSSQQA